MRGDMGPEQVKRAKKLRKKKVTHKKWKNEWRAPVMKYKEQGSKYEWEKERRTEDTRMLEISWICDIFNGILQEKR